MEYGVESANDTILRQINWGMILPLYRLSATAEHGITIGAHLIFATESRESYVGGGYSQ